MTNYQDFYKGSIPEKTLNKISDRITLGNDERIILFLNHSLFGSSRHGTVFTDLRVIHFKKKYQFSKTYNQIKQIRFTEMDKMYCALWIDTDSKPIQLGSMVTGAYSEFCRLMKDKVSIKAESHAMDEEKEKLWNQTIGMLKDQSPTEINLHLTTTIDTGGKAFLKKAFWGMLTGGIGAVTESRYLVDMLQFPDNCALCGLVPGTQEKSSQIDFKRGSEATKLTGVTLNSVAILPFKVCRRCEKQTLEAIRIKKFVHEMDKNWLLSIEILNPKINTEFVKLNASFMR